MKHTIELTTPQLLEVIAALAPHVFKRKRLLEDEKAFSPKRSQELKDAQASYQAAADAEIELKDALRDVTVNNDPAV